MMTVIHLASNDDPLQLSCSRLEPFTNGTALMLDAETMRTGVNDLGQPRLPISLELDLRASSPLSSFPVLRNSHMVNSLDGCHATTVNGDEFTSGERSNVESGPL